MHDLDWLIGLPLQSVVHREQDWVFAFGEDVTLVVECLWRMIEDGHIAFTSNDNGHTFGLPAPLDVAKESEMRLANATIDGIALTTGTLDIGMQFGTKYSVQIVPDSGGYEAWNICHKAGTIVAVGGGQLVVYGEPPTTTC